MDNAVIDELWARKNALINEAGALDSALADIRRRIDAITIVIEEVVGSPAPFIESAQRALAASLPKIELSAPSAAGRSEIADPPTPATVIEKAPDAKPMKPQPKPFERSSPTNGYDGPNAGRSPVRMPPSLAKLSTPANHPVGEEMKPVPPPVWQNQPPADAPPMPKARPITAATPPLPAPIRPAPREEPEDPTNMASRRDRVRSRMLMLAPEVPSEGSRAGPGAEFFLSDRFDDVADKEMVKAICLQEKNFEYRSRGKRLPVIIRRVAPGRGGMVDLNPEST